MNEIDFRIPTDEEHRKVVKGLCPFTSKGFCLRVGFHLLVLIATQAFILWNAYSQVLPIQDVFLVGVAAFISHIPVWRRSLWSAYTKQHPQPFLIFGIFSLLLDVLLVIAANRVQEWGWVVYIPLAIAISGWHLFLGTKIYRNERMMHRAVNKRNYRIIEVHVSNCTKEYAGHGYTIMDLFKLEVATENNDLPFYIFEVYYLTWRFAKRGTEGYLLTWEDEIKGKTDTFFYFSKGR